MNRLFLTLVLLGLALPVFGQHPSLRIVDTSADGVTIEMTAQWPRALASLRDDAGTVIGSFSTGTDITERRLAEAELQLTTARLVERTQQQVRTVGEHATPQQAAGSGGGPIIQVQSGQILSVVVGMCAPRPLSRPTDPPPGSGSPVYGLSFSDLVLDCDRAQERDQCAASAAGSPWDH